MAFPFDQLSWLIRRRYKMTPPVAADGDTVEEQCDVNGNSKVRVVGGPVITGYHNALTPSANGVVRAAPCKLVFVHGFNDGADPLYVGLYNRTSVPSGSGVAPLVQFRVPAGGSLSFFPPEPLTCSTGLVWAASATPGEWSSPGGADICIQVAYQ